MIIIIDYIRQRVINKIHCLRRLLPLSSRVTALLYKLYVLPIFDYCDCIWAQAPDSLLNKIDRLHAKFLNFITSSNSLVLPSLPSSLIHRRRFHLAVQSFKILHGCCPSYLSNLLCYSNVITGRISRNPYRAFVPAVRTNYGRDAISFQAIYLWNNLISSLYQC